MKDTNRKKNSPPSSKSRRKHIYGRFIFMSVVLLILSGLCISFMINTTVVHAKEWRAKGDRTASDTISTKPLRGDILACDGSILATNLNYYNIRIDFHASRIDELEYVESMDSLADTLAHYYPERTRAQWKKRLEAPMKLAKKKRSRSYLLLKEIPFNEKERIKTFPYFRRYKSANQSGLTAERTLVRSYPYGDMARLSIGRVGQTVDNPEIHGISGLEKALDSTLYGEPGKATKVLLTRGSSYWDIDEPKHGATVTTTIDITMQDILESELGRMVVDSEADWGSAMIMDVKTGDIKAISNLDRDPQNGKYIESRNHIVLGYEPGSVIKVISMVTALEDGYANLNRVYDIGYSYAYAGGSPIRDSHSPGQLAVKDFIEYSSNIGMTKLITPHYEGNLNGFRERLREIGFFDRLNTGMSQERPPYYPTLDPKSGGRVSLARMVYGYATQVPPLYTCAIYNAIANGGKFVRPRLIKSMHYSDGTDTIIPVSYVRDRICSEENARILRQMIHSVVWGDHGTARGVRNNLVEIAGKTGTAYIANERPVDKDGKPIKTNEPFKGGYSNNKRYAFCGFFPYDNPKYTCIVLISSPRKAEYGSANRSSGAVLREVALKLYSRGLLDNNSDYTEKPNQASLPTLYRSQDSKRYNPLSNNLNIKSADVIKSTSTENTGGLPDVTGLGIREALVKLESLGAIVNFKGMGYVTATEPPAGTPIKPNMIVNVTLSQN